MAKTVRVWGIDIGQCALKALHCVRDGDKMTADAFDYVEYPKILSQPESDPEAMIRDALQQFLSRNQISREDKVCISVPGQSGLAKFFKPPPVDVKKIPDIVRYEAKQQIPFPLEEVIWDFQQMAGGSEVDGFAIDTEVGLFAMKREQVHRHIRPFERAEIELDVVQLSPLSIYNFVAFDVLRDGPSPDLFDPDDPPESVVVLSMGTDATDLVVTNGFRVWQRSIPLGGSHFTKQLTKELKLTFAKAEHLKRNARQAEDPKAVFQAMRPIFNDMVTEIQRSIGYFQSIDRKAKIRGVVLLGNAVKLPGLQQYVAKNLGYEVIPFDKFHLLEGPTVLSSPAFTDNLLTYGVCYGLCLQGAGLARLNTNLLPREILTQRIIRAKKPWAVASVGALMLACALNFSFNYSVWSKVREEPWKAAEGKIDAVKTQSSDYVKKFDDKKAQLTFVAGIGEEVVGAGDRRLLWLELLKAIDAALPVTEGLDPRTYVDFKTKAIDKRKELHIEYIESEYLPDVAPWFTQTLKVRYFELQRHLAALRAQSPAPAAAAAATTGEAPTPAAGEAPTPAAGESAPGAPPAPTEAAPAADAALVATDPTAAAGDELNIPGPQGPGWIVELRGYHYFNSDRLTSGATHIRNTILRNLEEGWIDLPVDNGRRVERFTFKELGISYPVLAFDEGEPKKTQVRNPDYEGPATAAGATMGMSGKFGMGGMGGMMAGESTDSDMGPGMMGPGMGPGMPYPGGGRPGYGGPPGVRTGAPKEKAKEGEEETPPFFFVPRYSFVVQFCWQPKTIAERLKAREELLKQQASEAGAADAGTPPATAAPAETPAPTTGPAAPAAPAAPPATPPTPAPSPAVAPAADATATPAAPPAAAPSADASAVPAVPPPAAPTAPSLGSQPPGATPATDNKGN